MADNKSFKDKLKTEGIKFKGFGLVYKFVMEDTDLSLEAKAIYAYHCSFAGNKDSSFPKRTTILHDLQLSKEGYYSHYNQLIANGYIKVEKKGKGLFSQNVYMLIQRPEKLKKVAGKDGFKYNCLKDYGYGIVSKAVMLDRELDIKAKGLYAYTASYSGKDSTAQLRKPLTLHHLGICESTYHKYHKQLTALNYVTSEQQRTADNRFGINCYHIIQMPQADNTKSYPHNPQAANNIPSVKKQDAAKPSRKKQDATNITRSNKICFNKTIVSSSEKAELTKKIEDEIINIQNRLNYHCHINALDKSDRSNIDKSIKAMAEVIANKADDFVIGKSLLKKEAFRDSINSLRFSDITSLWDRIKNLENPIVNIENYLISALYNQGIAAKTEVEKQDKFDVYEFFESVVRAGMSYSL